MGWGRMLLLGNIGQQLDIHDSQQALAQIGARLRAAGRFDEELARQLEVLASENAELKLYLAAVVRLLVAKGAITEPELKEIVDAVDRSDGKADGRFDGAIAP
jgi:hypothetical protein